MKKLILALLAVTCVISASAQLAVSTNVAAGRHLLLSGPASAYSFTISATNNTTVKFYDNSLMTVPIYGTNTTNQAYTTRTSYSTNYVTSYVDFGGFTNWYTNAGMWTINVTNAAATNVATPIAVYSASSGQVVTYDNQDTLFTRGIVIDSPTYGVGVTVTYRPNR